MLGVRHTRTTVPSRAAADGTVGALEQAISQTCCGPKSATLEEVRSKAINT